MGVRRDQWAAYFDSRDAGHGVAESAKVAQIDRSTAYKFERGEQTSSGLKAAQMLGRHVVAGQLVPTAIDDDAREALDDFALFRLRYFGRRSTPWQVLAAAKVLALLRTPDREFCVINSSPGGGKSTLFTHDIPAWLIAQDRTIRIQVGSRTERQARMYVGRLKRTLSRNVPLRNDPDLIAAGIVQDASATMATDFGVFQPEGRSELWRAEGLVVRQTNGQPLDDKEPTVSAWGSDSGFMGGRFDLVVWDDLVDNRNTRTAEAAEALRHWYTTEAETRIDPGGVLILQGQRIAVEDLYRYALDLRTLDDKPKYHHVTFPAHDDDRCTQDHATDAKAWPDGCLLDPYRLPWRMLETIKASEPRTYALQYQQRDDITFGGLVQRAWIEGGTDEDGTIVPGCLDSERDPGTFPPALDGAWSFITVDPSPSNFWGIGWWAYDEGPNTLHALQLIRRRLTSEQFLSFDINTGAYAGLLHEIWLHSAERGNPVTHVVVEINAAQRWLVSQPHVQRWQKLTGTVVVPHQTQRNKNDPDYGVESLGGWFKHGRIRLPWRNPEARRQTGTLLDEVFRYPNSQTTDMLMCCWFATLATTQHYSPRKAARYRFDTPFPHARRGLQRG